jgi:hypothetical protein
MYFAPGGPDWARAGNPAASITTKSGNAARPNDSREFSTIELVRYAGGVDEAGVDSARAATGAGAL